MTALAANIAAEGLHADSAIAASDHAWRRIVRSGRVVVGGGILLLCVLVSVLTLPLTVDRDSPWYFDAQNSDINRQPPQRSPAVRMFGTDTLGRSILARSLFGGAISLAIGVAAAALSVFVGVT